MYYVYIGLWISSSSSDTKVFISSPSKYFSTPATHLGFTASFIASIDSKLIPRTKIQDDETGKRHTIPYQLACLSFGPIIYEQQEEYDQVFITTQSNSSKLSK